MFMYTIIIVITATVIIIKLWLRHAFGPCFCTMSPMNAHECTVFRVSEFPSDTQSVYATCRHALERSSMYRVRQKSEYKPAVAYYFFSNLFTSGRTNFTSFHFGTFVPTSGIHAKDNV